MRRTLACSIWVLNWFSQSVKTSLCPSNDSHFWACKNRQLCSCWFDSTLAAFRRTFTRSLDVLFVSFIKNWKRIWYLKSERASCNLSIFHKSRWWKQFGARQPNCKCCAHRISTWISQARSIHTILMFQILWKVPLELVNAGLEEIDPLKDS